MIKLNQWQGKSDVGLSDQSRSNRELMIFIAMLCLAILMVTLSWFVVGVWAVVPFAAVELGLLMFLMAQPNLAPVSGQ